VAELIQTTVDGVARGDDGAPGHPDDAGQLDDAGDPEAVARLICLRMLDRRAYTRAELATALRRRGVPDSAAEIVLDRFTELGLIDDSAFANEFVAARHRLRGQTGPALASALRRRGVDEHVVRDALAQIDPASDHAAARSLARSRLARMGAVDEVTAARRLFGLLARRGHSPGVVSIAVREVMAERAAAGTGAIDPDMAFLREDDE
jgi:regulatory protein